MDEKVNLDLSKQIGALMDLLHPNEPYVCYLAHKIKDGEQDKVAIDGPVIWKGATTADMLAFWGSIMRAASIHAVQFVESLPESERKVAMKYLASITSCDLSHFQINVPPDKDNGN
jgi:hypothetical protein